jgi:phage terminase large subunit
MSIDNGYVPFPKQLQFHQSRAKFRAIVAGRYGGKTIAGVNECIAVALNGNGILSVPNHGVIVAPTEQMLFDDIFPVLDIYLPTYIVKRRTNKKIVFNNGSTIRFRSAHNAERLRGLHPDWAYFDECAYIDTERAFYNLLLGLKTDGYMWFTTTPKGFNWFYLSLISYAVTGSAIGDGFISDDGDYFAIKWATRENPARPEESVKILERAIRSDKLRKQELEANFVAFEGAIYPFEEDEIKAPMPPYYTALKTGVDAGYDHPAVLEVFALYENIWYIINEFVVSGKTASKLAKYAIDNIEIRYGTSEYYMSHERPEIRQEFIDNGLKAYIAETNVAFGIDTVTDMFTDGTLKVVHAPLFLNQMKAYHWDKDKIYKKHDDSCDAVRYGATATRTIHRAILKSKTNYGYAGAIRKIGNEGFIRRKNVW